MMRRSWMPSGRWFVIGVPELFLFVFLLLPFLILLKISFSHADAVGVGFEPLISWLEEGTLSIKLHFDAYLSVMQDDVYLLTYLSSVGYALLTTVLCLIIGYPFAYFLAQGFPTLRPVMLMLIMLPFWTPFLIRIYAWKNILDVNGLLNQFLLWAGIVDEPLQLMFTKFSFMVGMVYGYIPFMILPLYANLVKLDRRLLEAAADLGARPWQRFWLVTIPLSREGILAGSLLVFIPAVGEYVIPELLGGISILNIGRMMWNEFFINLDWQRAAAVTMLMVLIILFPIWLFNRYQMRLMEARR
ncbi:ABC transporter permease [Tepidiphilus margaritifer]|uniref:ABC transporter permease n=1 Tax=Tepidiphilus margaritifer TaxID=203471 RepID=UPI0003FAA520|nr:ABC transporter permease subunit [Tepidiphilus margaritifer]